MAPPNNRRTGFSKRAQYNAFYAYLAGFVGVVLGVVLLLVSLANHSAFSGLRGVAADAVAPVGRVAAAGRSEGSDILSSIGGFFTSGARNARLQQEAEVARVKLAEADDLRAENARLKALIGLPNEEIKPVALARVIASTPASSRRFATLSVGRGAGVDVGMPVRSPLGLVGRVLEVSSVSARVLLITDSESMVPVRRAKDGIDAFAQGNGDGRLRLRLINLGINPLKLGDVMVTSGSGGLYRPGIAVAVVTELTRDGGFARVLSDPSSSEFVQVELPFAKAAQMPDPDAPVAVPVTGPNAPAGKR